MDAPMSESRGAASVTLDTIIANALEGQRLGSFWVPIYARAVTDALLAVGRIQKRELPVYTDAQVREQPHVLELVIPVSS
jgi:hypothetical protein